MTEEGKLPGNIRWCVSTLGCSEMNLAQAIELAQAFGVREIELRALEDQLDLPTYLEATFETPENLKSILKQKEIEITAFDTSLKLIGNTEETREAFLRFIPWSEALQVPWLRVFDGGKLSTRPSEKDLEAAAQTTRWWQALRRENGWTTNIVMETHDAFCNAESCLAFQSQLETPCPILWDAHHTFHKGGEPINQSWQALKPYIAHIHFKDSVREANKVNDYTLCLPGTGRFPVSELIETVASSDYTGAICLEWERKWQPWVPSLSEALGSLITALSPTVD